MIVNLFKAAPFRVEIVDCVLECGGYGVGLNRGISQDAEIREARAALDCDHVEIRHFVVEARQTAHREILRLKIGATH